jgi:hypothetical protein
MRTTAISAVRSPVVRSRCWIRIGGLQESGWREDSAGRRRRRADARGGARRRSICFNCTHVPSRLSRRQPPSLRGRNHILADACLKAFLRAAGGTRNPDGLPALGVGDFRVRSERHGARLPSRNRILKNNPMQSRIVAPDRYHHTDPDGKTAMTMGSKHGVRTTQRVRDGERGPRTSHLVRRGPSRRPIESHESRAADDAPRRRSASKPAARP